MQILNHFNTSVEKALSEIFPKWRDLNGLIICGTHTPHNPEILIDEIKKARENKTPFLGICFGHQLAYIEYCRETGIKDATSEEWGEGTFMVKKRNELKVGLHDGESWWSNFECVDDNFPKPEHFITVPYHPEYNSSIDKPHPILVKFLEKCHEN